MKKLLAAFLLAASICSANAQQPVKQNGLVTPGHLPAWVTNGVIQDGGTAQTPGITSIGTIGQGSTICANSGPQTGPYNQLCLGVNLASAAQMVLQNFGGAAAQTLQFVINGATYTFPFVATGVVGPGTTVVNDLACWNNTVGTLLKDCSTFTFPNSNLLLLGSSTGTTTFFSANSSATNYTLTIPANTGTIAETNLAQTFSAAQTINSGDLLLAGATSGTTAVNASATASGTATLPANTGTVAELNLAQTWTAAQTFTNSDILLLGSSTGATTFTSGNASGTNYTATIPANTGTVSELNLAQTWTAAQTFTNSDILLLGSSTGATTFTSGNSSATNYTATIPANTGTVAELNLAQTWTAAQTFTNSDILLLGSSTGATTFTSANSGASNFTATVPANTGTIAELNLAQTWSATQNLGSANVLQWNADTGLSRGAAATIDVGNGTAADVSGTIVAAHATLGSLANVATTSAVCYNVGTGVLTYDGTIGTCNTSSMRFKHNIQPFKEDALAAVLRMQPKTFLYNKDQHTPGQQLGLMAEDLAAIDPKLVSYDDEGHPNSIRYLGPMFSYLIGAIQAQQKEIEQLKAKLHAR